MLVIQNIKSPGYNLNKKSNFICYHDVRNYVAMGEYLTGHVRTYENCDDLATKVFYGGKRRFHMSNLLYNIYDGL